MRKEFKYAPPELMLLITKKRRLNNLDKIFEAALRQVKGEFVVLPLAIESRDMDNMLRVLKLMDVGGAYIAEEHAKHGHKLADKTDGKGPVNVVVQRKNKYLGYSVTEKDKMERVATVVKLWTNKKIDRAKLTRAVGRLKQ